MIVPQMVAGRYYQTNPKVSHIVFNECNSGSTFKQWSKGLSLAQGKYVWIAESDDFADPCFLELIIHELESNKKAILAFTGSQMVNEYGENIEKDWDHFSSSQHVTDEIFPGKSSFLLPITEKYTKLSFFPLYI